MAELVADENKDLLDLDDELELPDLPEDGVLTYSRPRRPWLLFGAAIIVIILATYIIVRIVMHDAKNSSIEIDLNTPSKQPTTEQVVTDQPTSEIKTDTDNKTVAEQPQSEAGVPVRVVEERKDVMFKPDATSAPAKDTQKIEPPKPRPITKTSTSGDKIVAEKPVSKPSVKPQASVTSNFYVQFGSYATRSGAEVSKKRLLATHSSLFSGHDFVIQRAVLSNGKVAYRLRIGFQNSQDANGFCRNAKSDGLDCYVTK
ncbi:MAG: SPOR domain-containing protein [Alphaproteobacteria bacterium]|jgi:cell division protein FtsN